MSNLKQISLGLRQYMVDYDERLPIVKTEGAAYGWAESLFLYIKSHQVFQCAKEINGGSSEPTQKGYTDYYYNSLIGGRQEETIGDVREIIVFGDGNDGVELTNARYAKNSLPREWRENTASPMFRHNEAANYAFVDGHIKRLTPEQVSTNWEQNGYYFEPRKPR